MTHVVKTADGGTFEPVLGEKSRLLNEHTRHEIDEWIGRFPTGRQRSAVLSALRFTQEQNNGFLTPELMDGVAEYLRLPSIQVYEVATFYSMFETRPVGRNNVAVCTNISCWLSDGEDILRHCEKKLGVKVGESTADGRVYLKQEEECLAACCGAPMMVVNGHYHEHLTPATVDQILDELK